MDKILPFGEWLPDMPELTNPGALTAKNVFPRLKSYGPIKKLTPQASALAGRARGGVAARDAANDTYMYAADAASIYEIRNQTPRTVGSSYAVAEAEDWEFAVFSGRVIATNFTDHIVSIATGTASFSQHITTPTTLSDVPKAKHIGAVRNQLVLGYTNSVTDGVQPNQVRWSAIDDSRDFVQNNATQSDSQLLPDGGQVQRIIDGVEYGLIFQESTIRRMSYVGAPAVFDLDPIDRKRGTHVPKSVIGLGRSVFFYTEEGFFRNDGGSDSTPIGDQKIDKYLESVFDPANAHYVSSAVDRVNKLIMWALPTAAGIADRIYCFNYAIGRWSEIELSTQLLISAQTQQYTLEDLDSISTDIDNGVLDSFDSGTWRGGFFQLGAFQSNNRFSTFSGANMAATIDTAEVQFTGGRNTFIENTRPLVDGGSPTVSIGHRSRNSDPVVFSAASSMNSIGECPQRNEDRYQRFRVNIPEDTDWEHAQGVEVEFTPAGRR